MHERFGLLPVVQFAAKDTEQNALYVLVRGVSQLLKDFECLLRKVNGCQLQKYNRIVGLLLYPCKILVPSV